MARSKEILIHRTRCMQFGESTKFTCYSIGQYLGWRSLMMMALFFLNSCTGEERREEHDRTPDKIVLEAIPEKHLNSNYLTLDIKSKIKVFLENYLNTMYQADRQSRRIYWDKKDLAFFRSPDIFMKTFVRERTALNSPPVLLSIQQVAAKRYLAVLLFNNEKGHPIKIFSVVVQVSNDNQYRLSNVLFSRTQDFKTIKSPLGSEYIISPLSLMDEEVILRLDSFNQEMATFFNESLIPYKAIITPTRKEYTTAMGFEYAYQDFLDYPHGGMCYPSEQILMMGHPKGYSPHEIVHLYTAPYAPHPWINEGLCTYFGGAATKGLNELMVVLANHLDRDPELSVDDYPNFIAIETRYSSVLGGLLIQLAMEEYGGKEAVFKLLNAGATDEAFYQVVKEVFQIDRDQINSFIRKKIQKYAHNE